MISALPSVIFQGELLTTRQPSYIVTHVTLDCLFDRGLQLTHKDVSSDYPLDMIVRENISHTSECKARPVLYYIHHYGETEDEILEG